MFVHRRLLSAALPALLFLHVFCAAPSLAAEPEGKIDFNRQIRSILAENCFKCHGPDAKKVEGGLQLNAREPALAELDSGEFAIVPGKPKQSALVARINSDDPDERMPPPKSGGKLSAADKQLLRRWIEQGSPYARHWSFVPLKRETPPAKLSNSAWVRNPIDRFVMARLDAEKLKPSAEADRYAIIRRVSLDLTGLPPSINEVDRFVADNSPQAYEKVVDRLLKSPAFGERWARVWLDLARYADSAGYAQDPARTIWRYRDWVIQAINSNMRFDQFTIEQLAGDMLSGATEEQILATAFHRNTMTNSEGGTDDEEFRNAAIIDRVNTTMQVWMGLTIGCAQCHSHKYDPITQEEFFRFFAILNNTEDADRGNEAPLLRTLSIEQKKQKARLEAEIAKLEKVLAKKAKKPVKKQITALKKQIAAIKGVTTPIMRELPEGRRRKTHIQLRGNFLVTDKEVTAGVPSAFHPLPVGSQPDRLGLAKWLVDKNNPLTARVLVNRHWEQLFGIGIVETSEDFGTQGEPPSHPALLDYLAADLVQQGWDTKKLLKTIVTSATYRQSSAVTPELVERDPQNRLLARGPRFRLPAEMIRDQALAIGGLLSGKMYGPSVRPPRPVLGLRAAFGGSTDWKTSGGEDKYRRGLYTSWRRTTPYPSLTTFDAPSREVCTIRRIRTNTPLQALVTLNDPVFVEAAQALARRMVAEGGKTVDERTVYGFRLCLARAPSKAEQASLMRLYEKALARYAIDEPNAKLIATNPLGPAPKGVDIKQLAAWTVVGNVLLNLDEVIAKR
ncbi:MAG: PSD1 domain-containing protein [Planctomycetes bacterium]|nr:PSD1 domain-containing protein [Planctomycetota bacterium]